MWFTAESKRYDLSAFTFHKNKKSKISSGEHEVFLVLMKQIKINNLSSKNIWDFENAYYWFGDNSRILKILAHFELFKKTLNLKGNLLEFGVCKGSSLIRTLTFISNFKQNKKFMVLIHSQIFQ